MSTSEWIAIVAGVLGRLQDEAGRLDEDRIMLDERTGACASEVGSRA